MHQPDNLKVLYSSDHMKNLRYIIGIVALVMLCGTVSAQNRQLKKGDKLYEHMVYPGAIKQYERGLAKGADLRAMERLADAYEQLSDCQMAEKWYAKIVTMKGVAPANILRYGLMLKANGNYAAAREAFDAYLKTGANPASAARMVESCDFALQGKKDSLRYQISPEPCNTKGSEFGPTLYQQGMIVVAEARTGGRRFLNLRNNNNFYDLYYAERNPKKKSGVKMKALKGQVNRKFHDGPATLTKDQSHMYFTRSNYVKNRKGRAPMQQSKLKIFSADLSRGKWKNVMPMPFNSENYSCGHPALSADGNTLVFASNIPGGFGGSDLYVCRKEGDAWSTPANLGSAVNTEGEERFPYLHPNGTLYFASTGHPGFGGLDIFAAPADGDKWGKAINGGYGLNSSKDDFSITWLPGKSMGYLASNRAGDDNIYMFKRQMKVSGTIVDKQTGKPIPGVAVVLLDASNQETKYITDAQGSFSHHADWGKEYLVTANGKDYIPLRDRLNTNEVGPMQDLSKTFTMEKDLILSVSGLVTDAATNQPIPGASVRIVSSKDRPYKTDGQGNYFAQVEPDQEFAVIVQQAGYVPQLFSFSTEGKRKSEDFRFNAPLVRGAAVLVEGKTVVNESQAPLAGVNVRAIAMRTQNEVAAALSRKDGRFWQVVDPRQEPTLIASKIGYFSSRAELMGIDSTSHDTTIVVTIGMVPYEIGALVKIIYYEYNKSDIRKIASKDLLEIVYFLEDNPEASVELSSYTDSRGGAPYNEQLSQRRADAAVSYIVSKRIASKRVASKGYGESNLVNKCKDDVPCTDEEHSANRRTEIRITKLN
jgi:outer membrane protein OmpA-like peptidoglycan-associated protein/tetratricopeptide (TPR) repeat protein